jgi:hypothetical protein
MPGAFHYNPATTKKGSSFQGPSSGLVYTMSITPPINPTPGDMWFDSNNAALLIYINDGTSSQWVEISNNSISGLNEVKTAPTIASGVLALNCALGNVFHVSLNAAITSITFSNIPASGTAYGLTLAFTMDGTARAVTWPASVKWPSGTAPTLTSTSTKVDIFVLTTWDAGTTWYAMIGGQNF